MVQLGDLWGSAGSFGGGNTTGAFGMNTTGGFGTNTTGGFGMKPVAPKPEASMASIVKKSIEEDLSTKIEKLSLNTITDPIDTSELPQFPGHYLYIDEEVLESAETMQDMSRYQQYIDMETELLMDTDEGWQGETYEKSSLPKGVDKDFKRFTERVEYAPSQCVRYDHHGKPLLYAGLQKQHQQIINSTCGACGGPRSFEFQLMPPILSILPTVDVAAAEGDVTQVKSGNNIKDALDSWNVGMEFGTILVFTCQKDCHPADDENVTFVEEALIVQYETD
jgi:pre-rRNA-processing protein TSR4